MTEICNAFEVKSIYGYDLAEVREALRIPDHLPLLTCDARNRYEVRQTLIGLVEHVLTRRRPALAPPTP